MAELLDFVTSSPDADEPFSLSSEERDMVLTGPFLSELQSLLDLFAGVAE